MTSPYLPNDCIYYILKYLREDYSTLFNCILVNKFWCREAVPLLYTDPFGKCDYLIIPALILCFSKSEILQLKNILKRYINDDEFNKIDDIMNDEYEPLFEYPMYFKSYRCSTISIRDYYYI